MGSAREMGVSCPAVHEGVTLLHIYMCLYLLTAQPAQPPCHLRMPPEVQKRSRALFFAAARHPTAPSGSAKLYTGHHQKRPPRLLEKARTLRHMA